MAQWKTQWVYESKLFNKIKLFNCKLWQHSFYFFLFYYDTNSCLKPDASQFCKPEMCLVWFLLIQANSAHGFSVSSEGAQHIPGSGTDTCVLSPGFRAGSSQEHIALGIMWKKCTQLLTEELWCPHKYFSASLKESLYLALNAFQARISSGSR